MKTTDVGGPERGYDGGKKVNGRKRHLLVDTLGLVIVAFAHRANYADVTGARMVLTEAHLVEPTLNHVWADQLSLGHFATCRARNRHGLIVATKTQ